MVRFVRATVHGVAVVVALVLATFVQSISVTVPVLNSVYCTPTSVNAEGSMLAIEPPTVAVVSVVLVASAVKTVGTDPFSKSIS